MGIDHLTGERIFFILFYTLTMEGNMNWIQIGGLVLYLVCFIFSSFILCLDNFLYGLKEDSNYTIMRSLVRYIFAIVLSFFWPVLLMVVGATESWDSVGKPTWKEFKQIMYNRKMDRQWAKGR
jgi:hypothetical protein